MSLKKMEGVNVPYHHIRIDLEGVEPESGYIRVSDFTKTVQRVVNMVTRRDRLAARDRKPSFYLRVVGLGMSSPAYVMLEEVLLDPKVDRREIVTKGYMSELASIETEELTGVDYEFLRKAAELSKPIGESMKSVKVSSNGNTFFVDTGFRDQVARKLAPEEVADGFIRGMLEYINIHGDEPVFNVYPDIGPSKVVCYFRTDVLPKARDGIGRFVEVRGTMKYKAAAAFPHEITVQDIDILPEDDELPGFAELRGAFPGLTRGKTSEEYIRAIRDGADEN